MPAIRNGRGELVVYDMGTPPTNPPPPVERRQVSAERMADFAAERASMSEHDRRGHQSLADKAKRAREIEAASRARGAQRAGFVKGATKPHPSERTEEETMPGKPGPEATTRRDQRRHDKAERILAVVRATSSHAESAVQLGMGKHSIEMFLSDLRRRGELPEDVEALLRARNPAIHRGGRPRKATAEPAQILSTDSTIEGGEEGAPATAADDLGATRTAPAEEVATPPRPPRFDMDQDDAQEPPRLVELLESAARIAKARAHLVAELAAFDRDLRATLDRAEAELRRALA